MLLTPCVLSCSSARFRRSNHSSCGDDAIRQEGEITRRVVLQFEYEMGVAVVALVDCGAAHDTQLPHKHVRHSMIVFGMAKQ